MKLRRRGIFLVAVLFMSLLISMFVGAAISLAPASLGQAAQESKLQGADRAVKTGLAWVQARLRSDPDWTGSLAYNTVQPDFIVTELDGQVVGWVHEGPTWNRFRIRFNWQDGPVSPSDGLNDPAQSWPTFTLVSCNNLKGTQSKDIPQANGSGGSVTAASPLRVTLPQNSALISVEGNSGSVVYGVGGLPTGFSGIPASRVAEVVLKLSGPNQAVTPAAVMAAGDIQVALENAATSVLSLTATATQVTRLRTKGILQVQQGGSPNVSSSKGELSANNVANVTTNGTSSNVTVVAEQSGDGFYSIPAAKVKAPTAPATPAAGVYVVNAAGVVTYYDMNYSAYQAAVSGGTLSGGSTVTVPGISVTTGATSPKVRMLISQDLQVAATGSSSDFAIIPDGGAPVTNTTYSAPAATSVVQAVLANNSGWQNNSNYTGSNALAGWSPVFATLPGVVNVTGTWVWTDSSGNSVTHTPSTGALTTSSGWGTASVPEFAAAMAGSLNPSVNPNSALSVTGVNLLATAVGQATYSATSAPPPVGALTPSELELNMQAPSGGSLVVQNDGNLIFGSQIQGNGAALVSKADIQLIGTSSDLSSTPGAACGLNMYAQGNIFIDSFKLDSTGAANFHGVDLKGVVYSWGDIHINIGDASVPASAWGSLKLKGALVAFGGDPSNPVPGYVGSGSSGKVTIGGRAADIQFDPSFLMGLYQTLPTPLDMQIVSWHER